MRDRIVNEYFEYLYDLIGRSRHSQQTSFRKLLMYLHHKNFRYLIPNDQNRAKDGVDLRYRFAITNGYEHSYQKILHILNGPCSVLEMMVALANRCEETIMDDPKKGNRTGQWFWGMIVNLGLGSMYDSNFNRRYVEDTIERFLDREYSPDGTGGLFTIKNSDRDLRTVEIGYQLCWYLDNIV